MVLRVVRINTCKEIVILCIIGINLQLIISTIAEGCTNHITSILLTLAIE